MALNSLFCADVPLSNYSLTHSPGGENSATRLTTVWSYEQDTCWRGWSRAEWWFPARGQMCSSLVRQSLNPSQIEAV